MADIQFHSSEMAGFFAELLNGDLNDPQNPIYSFKEKGIPSDRWFACINDLHDAVQKGEVQTIEQLTHFVFDKQPGHHFSEEQQAEAAKKLTGEYIRYHEVYQKHTSVAEKWAEKNQELENDPKTGYSAELDKLCDLFGVTKDQTFHAVLAFTPNKKIEGQAWPRGFIQYSDFSDYYASKDNPQEFVEGTPVQVKKISTPLHEATHIMFKQAGLEGKLNNPQSPGMQRLIDAMEKEIDLDDPKKRISPQMSVRWNAVRAVDEAIAASTGKMVDIKYGLCGNDPENPDVKEWYAGFKPANDLAPFAFSLIRDYMKSGKKIDDRFFDILAERFENREKSNEKINGNVSADQKSTQSDKRNKKDTILKNRVHVLQALGNKRNDEKRTAIQQEKAVQRSLRDREKTN
ncbi:MAG: hypothetical protein J5787_09785 [Alphaproteobacteria bacterium]|nr:hypothetical protein [Alphaproteobacteria bacterium]